MSSIELAHISRRYGDAAAVDDISFRVEAGSFTVLLGPSGCGKSTTLRMIAGLDTPTAGTIRIGEVDVTQLPAAKRRLAMVFQSYALFPHLNVRENILFGLKVRREPPRDYPRRLARVASLMGLDALLERKPAALSGGQQQRVALARAIISEAPVCLMDEPLSNLDAKLRQEMRREIHSLQRQLGITMVYVTHDQTEAMSMADQVVLLNGGRIEQLAAPDVLYRQPASVFAARFIGTPPMNLLPLERLLGSTVPAGTHGLAVNACPPDAKWLGLRPEHLRLSSRGVPAEVTSLEYLGADSLIVCRCGQTRDLAVRVTGRTDVVVGQSVSLDWSPEHQHFFNDKGLNLQATTPTPEIAPCDA